MKTRNIYRGADFLGAYTVEQVREFLAQGTLLADDAAGENGTLVREWVEMERQITHLPRPRLPEPPDAIDRPEPPAKVKRGRPARRSERSSRRDFLTAGLGAVAGMVAAKAWSSGSRSGGMLAGLVSGPLRVESLARSLVLVRVDAAPAGCGTGFCIAPGWQPGRCVIATASHVVDHDRLDSLTGDRRAASVVTVSERQTELQAPWIWQRSLDVCAFTAKLDLEPLTLADRLPEPGDAVTAVGYLPGKGIVMAPGTLSGFRFDKVARIETTAAVIPGYSGGPVLNERGQVIGMSVTRSLIRQNQSWCVPLQELQNLSARVDFLRKVEEAEAKAGA